MFYLYSSAQEADVVFLEEETSPNPVPGPSINAPVPGPCTDATRTNEQHCFKQVQLLSQKT